MTMKVVIKNHVLMSYIVPMESISLKGKEFEDAEYIKIIAKDGLLSLRAFNGEIFGEFALENFSIEDVQIEDEGECFVSIKELKASINSFDYYEKIHLVKDSGELKVVRKLDEEEFQGLPLASDDIIFPEFDHDCIESVSVRRKDLLECIKKISFGIGFEKEDTTYLHWVLRLANNKMRAVSSNSARFVAYTREEKDIVKADKLPVNFLFSKEDSACLVKILEFLEQDYVDLCKYKVGSNYCVSCKISGTEVVFASVRPTVKWPDEQKIFNLDFPHKVIFKSLDWQTATKGVVAVWNDEAQKMKKPHIANMKFDFENEQLLLNSEITMRASRKVSMSSYESTNSTFDISCIAAYLGELGKIASKNEYFQIHLLSPDKPILVRFFSKDQVDQNHNFKKQSGDMSEELFVFFAPIASD